MAIDAGTTDMIEGVPRAQRRLRGAAGRTRSLAQGRCGRPAAERRGEGAHSGEGEGAPAKGEGEGMAASCGIGSGFGGLTRASFLFQRNECPRKQSHAKISLFTREEKSVSLRKNMPQQSSNSVLLYDDVLPIKLYTFILYVITTVFVVNNKLQYYHSSF